MAGYKLPVPQSDKALQVLEHYLEIIRTGGIPTEYIDAAEEFGYAKKQHVYRILKRWLNPDDWCKLKELRRTRLTRKRKAARKALILSLYGERHYKEVGSLGGQAKERNRKLRVTQEP